LKKGRQEKGRKEKKRRGGENKRNYEAYMKIDSDAINSFAKIGSK